MSVSGMCGMEKKRHRVTNTVAQMNPGISKSDTSKRRSQTIHQDVRFLFGSKKKTTNSIWRLASRSSGFLATRGRYFTQVCKAHLEKMSDIGLLPW